MKKLLLISLILTLGSCSALRHYNTDGLTYEGTNIYYNGELAATLGALEVAYDNRKIVYEATFILTSEKFNSKAINIIKFASKYHSDRNWEIEVELKGKQR
tara:strand:+ start:159 stop:461 length:303 start_codon:yes stop_codon:yes gene_type:complete